MTAECSSSALIIGGFVVGDETPAIRETYCADDCSPVLGTKFREICFEEALQIIQDTNCVESQGALLGAYCNFVGQPGNTQVLNETFRSVEIACGLNTPIPPTTCTDDCRNSLMNLADNLGCCYQSFYNVSSNLDTLYTSGYFNSLDKVLFEQIREPVYWEQCGVNLIPACGSSAAQFVASFVVVAIAMIAVVL